jgi:hypothetical protein
MGQKCKHTFRMKVELFLDIPVSLNHGLNKTTLRSKSVRLDGANWPKAYTYCEKCGAMPAV